MTKISTLSKNQLEELQKLNEQNIEIINELKKKLEIAKNEGFRVAIEEIKKLVDSP